MFIPFASPLKFADKLNPSSNSVGKSNFTVDSLEWKTGNGPDYPNIIGSFSSADKPDSSKRDGYHFKNFSIKNLDGLDYLKAPRVGRSETDTDLALQLHNNSSEATVFEENTRSRFRDKATIHSQDFYNSPVNRLSGPRNQETLCFSQNVLSNMPFRENYSLLGDAGTKSSIKVRTQLYRRNLIGYNDKSPKKLEESIYQKDRVMGGDNSHENVSGCSVIDSASGWNASPEKFVKAIGNKRFQKMRTAMIRHQRIFAGQVFELHRLVSVQKRLARSPNLFLEGNCNPRKPATLKKSSSNLLEIAPKVKPNTEKLNPETESPEKGTIPKFPLPSITKELISTKRCNSMVATTRSSSSSPWWFSAPGRQWLVPVVSPSEGLVYKPYTGPSPPTSGFMLPFYSNDSIEDALGFPLSHPLQHHENPFSQMQSLSSLSSRVSKAVPFSLQNSRESKDSDVQGSTASSPPERHKRQVLPLFPTEPTRQNLETDVHGQQEPLHPIKTTPYTSTSASESAARIFRTIQEERGHVHADNMIH
ncbi:PREDICTED: ELF3-like protein 2 isoform X2 [Tarenaya hassleriana]|nr:PREDICTED: ELF3-like protein 2 isoform X2 [Tarenaya hassleriana]